MARNRTIYNVQDLFFGLVSGETNLPDVSGHEVLKRIHRVQSVNYDFNVTRTDIGLLGKSSYDESLIASPPDISLSFSYFLEGLTNEKKIGFNVLTSGSSTNPNKEFTYNFVNGNREQNIYLAVNKEDSDVRNTATDPAEIPGLISSGRYSELGHPDATGMGLLAFQNCYINNYALDVTVGNYPKVDIGVTADNVVYYDTAFGLKPPILNVEKAEVEYRDKTLLLPKNYTRVNPYFDVDRTFRPSDAEITITKRPDQDDVLLKYDFEDGEDLNNYGGAVRQNVSTTSYGGLRSLKMTTINQGTNGRGAIFYMPHDKMKANEYYTFSVAIKVDSSTPKRVYFSIQNGQGDKNSLSFNVLADNTWRIYKHRAKLDQIKTKCYIYMTALSQDFYIDDIQIYKDAEKEPIQFHHDSIQSLKINVPLSRENISCIGHKYYADRPVTLPIKSSVSFDFLVQNTPTGNFLDNLRRDEEYDIDVKFEDENNNEAMKIKMFGTKFNGVSYSAAVGDNNSASANFSMSNDFDYGRNVISAEGRGLFILDYLVDDNLNILTDDQGNYMVDDVQHLF
tara:strand:+ start:10297 stop:11991 length:1695 start_codon:yes stop_codon:yes gene_type:complete